MASSQVALGLPFLPPCFLKFFSNFCRADSTGGGKIPNHPLAAQVVLNLLKHSLNRSGVWDRGLYQSPTKIN